MNRFKIIQNHSTARSKSFPKLCSTLEQMHVIRSLPSNPFQLGDVVIRNISTLSWARLLSIDPNARGTRCHESRNRLGKARERERGRERVQKPTPLAMPRYKYRTRIERGLIGPVAVFLVRSSPRNQAGTGGHRTVIYE